MSYTQPTESNAFRQCIDTGLASKAASLLKQWLLPESRQFHVIGAPRPRTTFEYNKLISTCRWQQDWQRALLLVTDIARESMQPTIVTPLGRQWSQLLPFGLGAILLTPYPQGSLYLKSMLCTWALKGFFITFEFGPRYVLYGPLV